MTHFVPPTSPKKRRKTRWVIVGLLIALALVAIGFYPTSSQTVGTYAVSNGGASTLTAGSSLSTGAKFGFLVTSNPVHVTIMCGSSTQPMLDLQPSGQLQSVATCSGAGPYSATVTGTGQSVSTVQVIATVSGYLLW
jgi:hypothetical protein